MQTMHPTLLIGPSDWDPLRLPREEFDGRIAALWRDHRQAGGAIVYGDSRDHAALAYLTHFTPKLEAALALIPRQGAPQLLIGGGVNMLPAAKPLTFIERLAPLRGAANTAAEWARALPADSGVVLIGGDAMPYAMRRALDVALDSDIVIEPGDGALRARMRAKSPREIAALREACVALAAAVAALGAAKRAGQGVTDCVLAAEHTAQHHGAQDVRSLFSVDGGRTLRPFDVPVAHPTDPLQVYLAVRHTGYWAEGFVMLADAPAPALTAAGGALQRALPQLRPGMRSSEAANIITRLLPPHTSHRSVPTLAPLGLSLEDERKPDEPLKVGEVLSLRAGVADTGGTAIISVMVMLIADGTEVLWAAPGVLGGEQ